MLFGTRALKPLFIILLLILVISPLLCFTLAKDGLTLSDQEHFEKALQYYSDNQFDKALAEINRAIRLNSGNSSNFHLRGNIYYELHQYRKAIENYNRAIQLSPNDASAYANRGWSERKLGKIEQAVQDWHTCNRLLCLAKQNQKRSSNSNYKTHNHVPAKKP